MALVKTSKVKTMVESGQLKPELVTGLVVTDPKDGVEKAIVIQGQRGERGKAPRHKKRHGWYSEDKKFEAATLYAAVGSVTQVAKLAKVPVNTVKSWTQEDWWARYLAQVRREHNEMMDGKITKVIDKALDKIMERIEEGDYVYDIKQGKAVAMPMSGRDLAIVTGTVFDKRQLIRGEATKIHAAQTSDAHLEKLAEKFAEFVTNKTKQKRVVEGEVIDAEVVDGG